MLRLLGPVEWISGGGPVSLGPGKQKLVVAALAVDAGRVVPWSTLTSRVWGDDPTSRSPRRVLYTYANRIRRALESMSVGGVSPAVVVRQPGGYALRLAPDLVDLHRFRRLTAVGRESTRADQERVDILDEALGLWCGVALADLSGSWAERTRTAWAAERNAVAVEWAETLIRLGLHRRVIEPVRGLLAHDPRAESLIAVLMRALVADGLATEAVEVYATYRARVIDELGVEPGRRLCELNTAILRGELHVEGRRQQPTAVAGSAGEQVGVSPPAQLPGDVAGFTGRAAEIATLDDALTGLPDGSAGTASTATVISVVSGTAGVGKTALATNWAHRVRGRFPDGQLFVDLRGFSGGSPISPEEALGQMLTALGVRGSDLPVGVEPRVGLFRTRLAGRRILILLDNAASSDQVRPLLPGGAGTMVVVTSRNALPGLVALHGAHRIDLDLLPASDARALLRSLIGTKRVDTEPEATDRLVEQCARLPLALRLVSELVTARPTAALEDLADELADRDHLLDVLGDPSDPQAAVDTVFSWSYAHLPAGAARAFRHLALHPGTDVTPAALAALVDTDPTSAGRVLDVLVRIHLATRTGSGRYGMHDLLRAYAYRLCMALDGTDGRRSAQVRLFDYYLAAVTKAVAVLYPDRAGAQPATGGAKGSNPANADTALAELDAERRNIVAVCGASAALGLPEYSSRLATLLLPYLITGYYADGEVMFRHVLAPEPADRVAEAGLRSDYGLIKMFMGSYEAAREQLHRALLLAQEAGDQTRRAQILDRLGLLEARSGNLESAARHHREAVALHRTLGSKMGVARGLGNLSNVLWRVGRDDQALEHLHEAIGIFTEVGDRTALANSMTALAIVAWRAGRHTEAAERGQHAVAMYQDLGNRYGEARATSNLGMVHTSRGQYRMAHELHSKALALFRDTGDRGGEALALNGLGEVAQHTGNLRDAMAFHIGALAAATDGGNRDEEPRAHAGLGRAHEANGDYARARTHWQKAVQGFTALQSFRADEARLHLTRLTEPAPSSNQRLE